MIVANVDPLYKLFILCLLTSLCIVIISVLVGYIIGRLAEERWHKKWFYGKLSMFMKRITSEE